MKISFERASQLAKRQGTMIFADTIVRADDVEVIGNWNKKNDFLIHFRNGSEITIKDIDIVRAIQIYLASLNGQIVDYSTFETNLLGYQQNFHSGFLLLPDQRGSCFGILAENIASLTNKSSKKKPWIGVTTKTNQSFNAEIGFEDAKAAYKEAIQGKNTVIWHKDWPFEKPQLHSLVKPRPAKEKLRIS